MSKVKKRHKIEAAVILVFLMVLIVYFSLYYRASETAEKYLEDSGSVKVSTIAEGLFLDGEGVEDALIFYPGANVEYTAYLPLMHQIAENGTDCFLVEMPLNHAIFDIDKADEIVQSYDYEHWFISGHSLGGYAATKYAADHELDGVILLAAYAMEDIDEPTLEIYGTEDEVLNRDRVEKGRQYLAGGSEQKIIEGGNHSQFGDYGEQLGDGEATISAEEQRRITAEAISAFIDAC